MGLLRSETMKYGTVLLQGSTPEQRKMIDLIGRQDCVQFEDMNAQSMRRPFRTPIVRLNEMDRILRFILDVVDSVSPGSVVTQRYDKFLDSAYSFDEVESQLKELYVRFVKFQDNNSALVVERNHADEELKVMEAALKMMSSGTAPTRASLQVDEDQQHHQQSGLLEDRRVHSMSGMVPRHEMARLAKLMDRISRGNVFVHFEHLDAKVADPKTSAEVEKAVFVIYFQRSAIGKKPSALYQKLVKVCQACGVNNYEWPADRSEAQRRRDELARLVDERTQIIKRGESMIAEDVSDLTDAKGDSNSKIEDWRLFCLKERSIYATLNMFENVGSTSYQANVWYPAEDEGKIKRVVEGEKLGAVFMADKGLPKQMPPTFIRTNEFTEGWQEVVNTYGIPAYKEANPALLTVVTFPAIFGMMYGDIGHGSMLLCAGLYLCWNVEKFRLSQPALCMARYMLVQMGIFSVFAGLMYNDLFSVGLPLFESRWEDVHGDGRFTPKEGVDVTNEGTGRGPYPFGVDSAWHGATNELIFMNSLKMKLSVLFGVLQMIVGLLLRWSNTIFKRSCLDFICECVPMMIFMLCFFGWMDFMILYKWNVPDFPNGAPSIINSMICMAMFGEDNQPLYDGATMLTRVLMVLTMVTVPCMLFPKPLLELCQHRRHRKPAQAWDNEQGAFQALRDDDEEEFEFGEAFIHQVIETIEYVLGTVSHTASYLRIWALSLAHQQLSLVFFQKTLSPCLSMTFPVNVIGLYIGFVAWFGITLGVLLGMDVLECFLHTLRLHWVEFQSKFFKAGGHKFEPFSIRKLIKVSTD